MPMLTMLRIRLPVWPFHSPCARGRKNATSCRARHAPRESRFAIDHDHKPFGARKATCSTARLSVMLIFSPLNIAAILAAEISILHAR